MNTPKRNGFTLAELLVVIAVVGTVTAMLFPAVQAARESARLVTCTNNLRQIGISIHTFHDANDAMPSLYLGRQAQERTMLLGGQTHSWRVAILPSMEHQALFDSINFRHYATDETNQAALATVLPEYLCPSTSRIGHGTPKSAQIRGVWKKHGQADERMLAGTTDYNAAEGYRDGRLGISGPWGEPVCVAPHEKRPKRISFRHIVDGLSKTIMVYERAGLPDRYFAPNKVLVTNRRST